MRVLLLVLSLFIISTISTPLDDYVNAPDPSYKWTLNNTLTFPTYTGYILELTSQTWLTSSQSSQPVWKHWLSICVPNKITSQTGFIYVDGGSNSNWKTPNDLGSTITLACVASNTITAGLNQIPNQPLIFNGDGIPRVEDALIAYTWRHFINDTSDPTWLARLPMTKAVVKAMDAIQEFGKTVPYDVQNFVISGASKRGWTTWTTGAVDSRVVAIVPIVMPILNMIPNMAHQWQAYGEWSFALNDYLNQGVMDYLFSPQMQDLADVVDPYTYVDRLTMPKYVVCSTGDEFFLPDSPGFFWTSMQGESHLRLVPNAEHSLIGHQTDILLSIVSFLNLIIHNQPRPQFNWNITYNPDNSATITMTVPPGSILPTKVKAWTAVTESTTRRDFRLITCADPTKCVQFVLWIPSSIPQSSPGVYTVTMKVPNKGWRGFFLEASYDFADGINDKYTLKFTSEVAIVPNQLPFPPFNPNATMIDPLY
eukprot:gene5292-6589_t